MSAWTSPANCSAIREDKRTAGQEEDKTQTQSQATEFRGGPEPGHRARPQSPATEFMGAAKRRTRGAQEEDKTWTQSPATEPGHRVQPGEPRWVLGHRVHRATTKDAGTRWFGAIAVVGGQDLPVTRSYTT